MGGHDTDNAAERNAAIKEVIREQVKRFFEQSQGIWDESAYTDHQFQQSVVSIARTLKMYATEQRWGFAVYESTAALDSTQYEHIEGELIFPSIAENKRWRVRAAFREGKLVLLYRTEQDAR